MQENIINDVRTTNQQSNKFTIQKGLRQGGVLSPTRNVVLNEILQKYRTNTRKVHNIEYKNMGKGRYANKRYVMDMSAKV